MPSSPPAKNAASAMNDGTSRFATPVIPCPDVQPPAYAVPNPTRNPPPTIASSPRGVASARQENSSRGTSPVKSWMPSAPSDRARRRGDRDRLGIAEHHAGQHAADHDAGDEGEVPPALAPPVVAEVGEPARLDRGAEVPQVARHAEHPVAEPEQQRREEPDQRTGDVPGPGTEQGMTSWKWAMR